MRRVLNVHVYVAGNLHAVSAYVAHLSTVRAYHIRRKRNNASLVASALCLDVFTCQNRSHSITSDMQATLDV